MASTTQTMTTPIGNKTIPSFLKGLKGVATSSSPPPFSKCRTVIVSKPKMGKTTLVNSFERALVLDCERSSLLLPAHLQKAVRFGPNKQDDDTVYMPTIKEYVDVTRRVLAEARKGERFFETVVFDTVNAWLSMHSRELCAAQNVTSLREIAHGNGYDTLTHQLFSLMDEVEAAGLGWVAVVQVGEKTTRTGEGDKVIPRLTLSDGPRNALKERFDNYIGLEYRTQKIVEKKVLSNGKEIEVDKGSEQVLFAVCQEAANPNSMWSRLGLRSRVPFREDVPVPAGEGWAALTNAYNRAVEGVTKKGE